MSRMIALFGISLLSLASVTAVKADVDMTLYNTVAMLNSDGVTPLQGNSSSGFLVQLISVGVDGVINPASTNSPGSTTGDDAILSITNNPTHVGAGMATPNLGKLVQAGMIYSNSLVGLAVYVRFWSAETPNAATQYGDSGILNLPAADGFGQAELDFLPTGSPPPLTSYSIPTLAEWAMLSLVGIILAFGCRHLLATSQPATSTRVG